MTFRQMRDRLQLNFVAMAEQANTIFEVEVDKDHLWNLYLDNFPEGTNEIYRERREHDCSCCRHFVRQIGNAVFIVGDVVRTIWDLEVGEEYSPSFKAMAEYIKSFPISNYYVTKERKIGVNYNFEQTVDGARKWEHFFLELPKTLCYTGNKSVGDIKGELESARSVFHRGLSEITLEAIDTLIELIAQNTVYRGEQWREQLADFRTHKVLFSAMSEKGQELYSWKHAYKSNVAKIRNTSIGTLLVNLSEGMEIDLALKKYEEITAPSNYRRPTPKFTPKMLQAAKDKIQELGFMDSLKRRHATLDDITINNILFANRDTRKKLSDDVFEELETSLGINPKKLSKVEEISYEKFVSDVLPIAKELELFLENKHLSNMVSLIAPQVPDAKTMFKWDNNFSWAYSGNVTDSLREQVLAKGGRVDGVLRLSSSWNHEGKRNESLMDFHVFFPNSNQIPVFSGGIEVHDKYGNNNRVGWNHRTERTTQGSQDVDYVKAAPKGYVPVENITFPKLSLLPEGIYTFKAHNWNFRGTANGFKCEIQFGDELLEFDYDKPLKHKEWVTIAMIELKNGQWKVIQSLKTEAKSKKHWSLDTQNFVPVSTVMYSPNYWNEQEGIGNRHLFFMLKGCVNPEEPNGFYNEFLRNDLNEHRKVFEAIGSKMSVEGVEEQLSGVGFATTKRADVIVKVTGQSERLLKIKF